MKTLAIVLCVIALILLALYLIGFLFFDDNDPDMDWDNSQN